MKMILVTGASGFVGRNLIPKMIDKGYKICCLLRSPADKKFIDYLKKNNVKIILGDLGDYKVLDKNLGNLKISTVVHLAGVIKSSNKQEYFLVNYKHTSNLIKLCKKMGINNIVFMSTDVVTKRGLTLYGMSKYKAELIIKKSGIHYIFLRSTVIYGKGDNKFIMKLVGIIKKFPIIPVIGNGDYIFQPVYVNDVVDIIIRCLGVKKNRTYNVCSDQPLTLNEIIGIISDALHKKVHKFHIPIFLCKIAITISSFILPNPALTTQQLDYFEKRGKIKNSLIKKELNFRFTSFREGIIKSLNS